MPNSNSHGARKSLGALTGPLRLTAAVGTAFSYAFPEDTFNDADTSGTLTYTATRADDSMLPTWLSFDAATRTFSGTPMAGDTGTVSVKVTASDTSGGSVSDEFDITVAAAPTVVLVSNIGQNGDSWSPLINTSTSNLAALFHAQGFTTGNNDAGYTLTSIDIYFHNTTDGTTPTVTLHEGSPTGTLVDTLMGPANVSGFETFTASSKVILDPRTSYFVVLEPNSASVVRLSVTDSDAEDATGETDWRVDNVGHYHPYQTAIGSYLEWRQAKRIRVNGEINNNPTVCSADTAARNVAENTAAGQDVGAVLTATDADSDTLAYALEGADAASFEIVTASNSAQIRTETGVTWTALSNTGPAIKTELEEKTEILNIPIEDPAVFGWGLDDGGKLLQRLVSLSEQQFQATGAGLVRMNITITKRDTLPAGHSFVWVTRRNREALIQKLRKEFDLFESFCYGFWVAALHGAGWDEFQLRLQVAWQTKANWDAVQAARKKAA